MGSSAGNIIKSVAPLVIAYAAPELAPALGIGAGLGTDALGAGLGAGAGLLSGGGLKGALTGALASGIGTDVGGIGSGGQGLISGAASDAGLSGAGLSALTKGLSGAATGFNATGNGMGALEGGGIGALVGGLSSALNSNGGVSGLFGGSGTGATATGLDGSALPGGGTPGQSFDLNNGFTSPASGATGYASGGNLNVMGGGGASSVGSNAIGNSGYVGYGNFDPSSTVAPLSGSSVTSLQSNMNGLLNPTSGLATSAAPAAAAGGGSNALMSALSGVGNVLGQQQAENQLVKSQQATQAELAPFLKNGTGASDQLSTLLGTNGNTGGAGYGSLTKPFTGADLQNTPGYQFDLAQGQNALNNMLSASGMQGSGAALKEAEQFGQGLANTTYQNAFNNNLAQNSNIYNELAGQTGTGLSAANISGQVNNNIGTAQSKGTAAKSNTLMGALANVLSGSGARVQVGVNPITGQPIYQ